jgi:hypothetical protein
MPLDQSAFKGLLHTIREGLSGQPEQGDSAGIRAEQPF